jgi:hypothetical protein
MTFGRSTSVRVRREPDLHQLTITEWRCSYYRHVKRHCSPASIDKKESAMGDQKRNWAGDSLAAAIRKHEMAAIGDKKRIWAGRVALLLLGAGFVFPLLTMAWLIPSALRGPYVGVFFVFVAPLMCWAASVVFGIVGWVYWTGKAAVIGVVLTVLLIFSAFVWSYFNPSPGMGAHDWG